MLDIMPTITLPNKDKKKYTKPVTSAQIASEISNNLSGLYNSTKTVFII